MKSFLKKSFFSILALLPRNRAVASILMYHSVGYNSAEFTVSPEMFEQQLRYLVRGSYQILPMSLLAQRLCSGGLVASCIALTFDDGFRDLYETVFPLIQTFRVPISIFVSTGYVGREFSTSTGHTLPMLSWKQIAEMKASGLVEFLPHGHLHHSLPTLPKELARKEILDCVAELEAKTGPVARIYAYAKGKYSAETLQVLEDEGFIAALTVRPGYVSAQSSLLELPRNHMDAHTTFAEFKVRVRGRDSWYEALKPRRI